MGTFGFTCEFPFLGVPKWLNLKPELHHPVLDQSLFLQRSSPPKKGRIVANVLSQNRNKKASM